MSQPASTTRRSAGKDHSPRSRGHSRGAPGFRVTGRDLDLLGFTAAHRFVLACQAQSLLGADRAVAYRRLSGLTRAGLLSYERVFHAQPGIFQITSGGLAVIDSPLRCATVDLRTYRHDVGVAWLWLATREGRFGAAFELWSEREMRSSDQRQDANRERELFGVPVDGRDRAGRPRVHHPDVLAVDQDGRGVALELELSMKSRRRLELILLGYGASSRIDRAVYLTDGPHVARVLRAAVEGLGLDSVISVLYLPGSDRDPDWWMWRSIAGQGGGR